MLTIEMLSCLKVPICASTYGHTNTTHERGRIPIEPHLPPLQKLQVQCTHTWAKYSIYVDPIKTAALHSARVEVLIYMEEGDGAPLENSVSSD